jgi:phosphatidylserine decarboxylase
MKFSRHGLWEMILGTLLLAAIGAGLGWVWWPLSLLVVPVWLWLMAFFRDPDRTIPNDHGIMVSPADGLVTDIKEIENDPYLKGPAIRVGIFLNVFNVHGNRAPCDGKITEVIYKKGKFINALKHDLCSAENEANTIVMADAITGVPVCVVRQIAGLIAKRIICVFKVGENVQRGERIGFIKFGSRTELTIPRSLAPVITVKVGDKVVGGSQIIAKLGAPANAIA